MGEFKVWEVGGLESAALQVGGAEDAQEAARMYAEQDSDGMSSGQYTESDGLPLANVPRDGHLLYVRDAEGVLTRWNVGVIEFEPVFYAAAQPSGSEQQLQLVGALYADLVAFLESMSTGEFVGGYVDTAKKLLRRLRTGRLR